MPGQCPDAGATPSPCCPTEAHMNVAIKKQDRLAFDRATSRVFDGDGHLHVTKTPISKACVNPYYGEEIPHWEELGLDPARIYQMLRHPDELAKAVGSFNNKPLLYAHKPINAREHAHQITVGTVSNPAFEYPYLYSDLACWDGNAIDTIEDDTQKELSSSYHYDPDMTAGTFEGVSYDGIMRNIRANHVALVPRGRAGRDVCVLDHELQPKVQTMPHTAPTRFSVFAQGAVSNFARSVLAQDAAKVDLRPLFEGLTANNFKARKPVLALGIKGALAGKLAADADLDDVEEMLDQVEEAVEELKDTVEAVPSADPADPAPEAVDASEGDILSFLSGKLSEEDLETVRGMLSGSSTATPLAGDEKEEKDKDKPAQDAAPKAPDMKNYVTKQAMDAAIQRAADAATAAATAHQSSLREAERFVRPWAGDLPAMDSAEAIYRAACDVIGIKHAGVHASALPVLIERSAKPGEQAKLARTTVAQDAASRSEAEKLFPHMNRLGA